MAKLVEVERRRAADPDRNTTVYTYLVGLFVGLLVIANVIAVKPVALLGHVVPVAVLAYAITFLLTDTIGEVWGEHRARHVVWTGLVTSIVVALLVRVAVVIPPVGFWDGDDAFAVVLGGNWRIVAASMLAYLASQFHDVWAFGLWRRLTKGRHLWLRNSASTLVSQFIDTVIFITVAFYGVWGGWSEVWPAIVGQYIVKLVIAIIDTPIVYALVAWVRRMTGTIDQTNP